MENGKRPDGWPGRSVLVEVAAWREDNSFESQSKRRVPLDKNEGVVKRHILSAMLSSTAWISEAGGPKL